MKIRLSYVSNSSSSSFCIMGWVIDVDNLPESMKQDYFKYGDELIDCLCSDYNEDHKDDQLKLIDVIKGISEYYDCYLIGAEPKDMKDEQTLLEFKQQVLKEIHKVGFNDVNVNDLCWHIDGGRDC